MLDLHKALHTGVVSITFTKKNGDVREMEATLVDYLLPEVKQRKEHPNPELITVFDLDANGWRSIRLDSITEVNLNEHNR